ncbi:MAG TPA: DUF5663 domain-containing protein [Candidatus Moranbacteria bacterium]|nr:DUF5663 domain-containing protein [Candidatus Moranbacteria bacterium]
MPDQNQSPAGGQEIKSDFLDELGLAGVSQEKKEELLVKMTEVLLKRIFIEVMEKLPESDQNEYARIIEGEAEPDKVEAFLKERLPNYEEMVKNVIDDFKEEMKR